MSTHDPAEASTSNMTSDGVQRVYRTYERRKEEARSARAHRLACRRLATGMKMMHDCIATMHQGLSTENHLRPRVQVVRQNNYQMPTPSTPREAQRRSPVDDVQGEGGIPRSSCTGPAPQAESLAPSREVFGPNQWQAPAQPIQMIHRSDQDVQRSQPPPYSNMPIQQHADLLPGRSGPINIPYYQPAIVQYSPIEHNVLYHLPYVNIPHCECALLNVPQE